MSAFFAGNHPLDTEKIAYDLALVYAQSKLQNRLQTKNTFGDSPAPAHVEEMEYLSEHFFAALEYFSGMSANDCERTLESLRKGKVPKEYLTLD